MLYVYSELIDILIDSIYHENKFKRRCIRKSINLVLPVDDYQYSKILYLEEQHVAVSADSCNLSYRVWSKN